MLFRSILIMTAFLNGCAMTMQPVEPDVVETLLPVSSAQVGAAISDVLKESGYDLDRVDDNRLTTGYRTEIHGPWDGLLRWRFGVGKSRVDVALTAQSDTHTHVRLEVFYQAKDGIFDVWNESPTPLPQSAEQQMRLIKRSLHLL